MQQLQLSPQSKGGTPSKKKVKSYHHKATEAAGYLFELLSDAVDYIPGELQEEQGILALKVSTNLGTKFTIEITFVRAELSLTPKVPSGILQTEYKKIRHFIEDLECYLNVAHTWLG